MCIYIYIHVYICVYVCIYIYTYVYAYTYIYTYIYTYLSIYISLSIYIYIYNIYEVIFASFFVFLSLSLSLYIYIYIYTYSWVGLSIRILSARGEIPKPKSNRAISLTRWLLVILSFETWPCAKIYHAPKSKSRSKHWTIRGFDPS